MRQSMSVLVLLAVAAIAMWSCEASVRPADARAGSPALAETSWKLTELDGVAPVAAESGREAHLVLHAQTHRLEGSGGVNSLSGSYELQNDSLRFTGLVSTMMAGPPALMEQEAKFQAALRATTSYRISGKTLELLDGARVLARLEASAPPK